MPKNLGELSKNVQRWLYNCCILIFTGQAKSHLSPLPTVLSYLSPSHQSAIDYTAVAVIPVSPQSLIYSLFLLPFNMAMSKSLRNPVILEAILEQFSTDSMDKEHLNLRVIFPIQLPFITWIFQLTSKLFNEICLRRIRKTHRHLKMRYCIGGDEDTKEEDSHALKINQHVVFLSKSKQYFR